MEPGDPQLSAPPPQEPPLQEPPPNPASSHADSVHSSQGESIPRRRSLTAVSFPNHRSSRNQPVVSNRTIQTTQRRLLARIDSLESTQKAILAALQALPRRTANSQQPSSTHDSPLPIPNTPNLPPPPVFHSPPTRAQQTPKQLTQPPLTPQSGPDFITRAEMHELLNRKPAAVARALEFDPEPPYPRSLAQTPYPPGYLVPKFTKFDGKKGNPREHVVRFIEALGQYSHEHSLRLREFSKSLTERAYRWYISLEPESISTWEQLSTKFHTKFSRADERVTTLSLTKETQASNEELIKFVRRFQDRAMECFENNDEKDLVDICIQGMAQQYRIHLINLRLESFGELIVAVRNLVKNLPPAPKTDTPKPAVRRPAPTAILDDRPKKKKPEDPDRASPRETGPAPFPVPIEEVLSALAKWTEDGRVVLPVPREPPTEADRTHRRFCQYHQAISHSTEDCRALRRIFHSTVAKGDLELTPAKDVRRNPYPRHPRTAAAISCYDELDETHHPSSLTEPDLGEPHQPIVAATSGCPPNYKKAPKVISFTEADKQVPSPQNRPLYVTATINDHEFKRAFLDNGSSINIMPLTVFKQANIPPERLIPTPIDIAGFGNDTRKTLGHVNIDLTIHKFRAPTKFHVIDAETSYHLLIGRAWMHRFGIVPSTYHQCFKGILGNKVVTVPCSDKPFAKFEAHFTDALFFDELDVCDAPHHAALISTPLPTWSEVQKGIYHPPQPYKQPTSPTEPTTHECKRVKLPDGRIIYRL